MQHNIVVQRALLIALYQFTRAVHNDTIFGNMGSQQDNVHMCDHWRSRSTHHLHPWRSNLVAP